MSTNNSLPSVYKRIYSVWYRHFKVYSKNIISNGFPPFLEPIIFLAGIGVGLGKYIVSMDNMPYIGFLAIGLPLSSAMFTASFECTFGTFIRLEYAKVYDGILTGPVSVSDLFMGEVLWSGTKGFFFATIVLFVFFILNTIPFSIGIALLLPIMGFVTGVMFSVIALLFTTFVKDINHLNFYITGFLSPVFMFSGVIFPVKNLPPFLQNIVEIFPLVHIVKIVRAVYGQNYSPYLFFDVFYCIIFTFIIGYFAIKRFKKRILL